MRLLNSTREEIGAAPTTEDVYIRIRLKVRKAGAVLRAFADIYAKRVAVFRTNQQEEVVADRRGLLDLVVRIPAHLLAETTYTVNVTVYTVLGKETKVVLDNALNFMAYGRETEAKVKRGVVAPRLDWTAEVPRPSPQEAEVRCLTPRAGSLPPTRTRGSPAASARCGSTAASLVLCGAGDAVDLFEDVPRRLVGLHPRARAAVRRQLRLRHRHERAVRRRSVLRVLPGRADSLELLRRSADSRQPRPRGQPDAADEAVHAAHDLPLGQMTAGVLEPAIILARLRRRASSTTDVTDGVWYVQADAAAARGGRFGRARAAVRVLADAVDVGVAGARPRCALRAALRGRLLDVLHAGDLPARRSCLPISGGSCTSIR